jgi:UDP:flavonoid glycosyltransferase YjiC (YdhE family)
MSRHYLFALWDGSGTVPPELSLARAVIERGHRVTVLADPTIEPEAMAAGADFGRGGRRRTCARVARRTTTCATSRSTARRS